MSEIDHFMITRINIGLYSTTPKNYLASLEAKNKWMGGKLKAHEKYLLPSIKYQTTRDFKIVWLIDDKTPDEFMPKIEEQAKQIDATIIRDKWLTDRNITEGGCLDGDWLGKFKPMIKKDIVAITRFDSDDIMAKNFMEVVKSHFNEIPPVCIDFWYRLTLDMYGELYLVRCIPREKPGWCTPAVTLIEKKSDFKSPFKGSHFKLGKIFPVKIFGEILWCKPERAAPASIKVAKIGETKLENIRGFEGIGF